MSFEGGFTKKENTSNKPEVLPRTERVASDLKSGDMVWDGQKFAPLEAVYKVGTGEISIGFSKVDVRIVDAQDTFDFLETP